MKAIRRTLLPRLAALLLVMCLGCAGFGGTQARASSSAPEDGSSAAGADSSEVNGPIDEIPIVVETPSGLGEGLYQPEFDIAATGAIVVSVETGLVAYEKNSDTPLVMASLVKMITCILVMESIDDLDGTLITSSSAWVYDELYGKNASTADIRMGETLSARELLYAMLLPSANEAALIVADYLSNGQPGEFVDRMNERAVELGCTDTHFDDPNGLSELNVTTARDMYLIAARFMEFQELIEIAGTDSYEMAQHEQHAGPYYITTTNRLIVGTSPYAKLSGGVGQYVVAGKTGSLGEWQNFASMATKDGESYICIVLNSPNEADELGPQLDPVQYRPALVESAALFGWVFDSLHVVGALNTEEPITELRVLHTTDLDAVMLLPAANVDTLLPIDADETVIKKTYDLPEYLEAPLREGEVVGSVTLSLAGQAIGTVPLLVSQDVTRNTTLYVINKVGDFFTSSAFIAVLVVVAVLILSYIGLLVYKSRKRAKQRAYRGAKPKPKKPPRR